MLKTSFTSLCFCLPQHSLGSLAGVICCDRMESLHWEFPKKTTIIRWMVFLGSFHGLIPRPSRLAVRQGRPGRVMAQDKGRPAEPFLVAAFPKILEAPLRFFWGSARRGSGPWVGPGGSCVCVCVCVVINFLLFFSGGTTGTSPF